MSYVAAIFLLYLETFDAFVCMCNILNRECHRAFYRMNPSIVHLFLAFSISQSGFLLIQCVSDQGILRCVDWEILCNFPLLDERICSKGWDTFYSTWSSSRDVSSRLVPSSICFLSSEQHSTTKKIRMLSFRILSVFAKSLSLEIVIRIWDLYILEGDYFLFRTALGLFSLSPKKEEKQSKSERED